MTYHVGVRAIEQRSTVAQEQLESHGPRRLRIVCLEGVVKVAAKLAEDMLRNVN